MKNDQWKKILHENKLNETSPLLKGDLKRRKMKFEDSVKDAGVMLYMMYKSAKSYGIDERKFKILLTKFNTAYEDIKKLLDDIQ